MPLVLKHKWTIITAVLLALGLLAPGVATAKPQVVVVDVQRAVKQCRAGKKAFTAYKRKEKELRDELQKLSQEITSRRDELQKTQLMLKAETKLAKEMELRRLARKFQERRRDASRELAETQRILVAPILKRMRRIIQSFGTDKGYHIVVNARAAIYYRDSVDVTNQVVAAYDKKYPE